VALFPLRLAKWQTRALRILASAALVAGIFWFVPFAQVADALREVRLGYVAGGMAVSLLGHYLQAFQLRLLLKRLGMPIGVREIFEINMTTRFYGQFLPSELMAGAVKLHRLAGPTKQWGEVVAALAFFRLANMLALLLLGLAFWGIEMPAGAGRWVGVAMLAFTAALMLGHLVLASPTANRFAQRLLPMRGVVWLQGRFVEKTRGLMLTMVESYRRFREATPSIATLAVMRHLLGILSFGLFALAVGVHLSFLTIGWIRVVMHVIMMLPISISGIGVREGSLVILLQEYAVEPSRAIALSLVLFATTSLVNNGLGGTLELRNVLLGDERLPRPARSNAK
jgi:uncharacterized protein (TIRG00374 family)